MAEKIRLVTSAATYIITRMLAIQVKQRACHWPSAVRLYLCTALTGLTMLGLAASAAEIHTMILTNNLVLTNGVTLSARLIVRASHITIDGQGATLQGAGLLDDLKSLEQAGAGILVEGCANVTIRNLRVRGFATGLIIRDGQALLIEDCDFSDNYHNPKHGWGELPPRGGLFLERTRQSVLRHNKANRVWDGLHLVDAEDNLIEDNDFSHCSNTCAKLWKASRNRFLRNNRPCTGSGGSARSFQTGSEAEVTKFLSSLYSLECGDLSTCHRFPQVTCRRLTTQ